MSQWYRMHDAPDAEKSAVAIKKGDAQRWNDQGYGIFITVNEFNGARRKENLRRVVAWAIDMDDGTKQEQRDRLLRSPLVPSLIVETKRGYQAWWASKDGRLEHWNAIVLERLVPAFGSDKNARDLCRILRVPGFNHLKDPANPFLVRTAWKHAVAYSERQIAEAFVWRPDPKAQKAAHNEARRQADAEIREQRQRDAMAAGLAPTESLWEAIYALDCAEALARLSGHWSVGGERYTFKPTARGRLNIFVDGKSSSCFIDENKRIGSLAGGGPTVAQWLRWFGHEWRVVLAVIKEVFPRLAEVDAAARRRSA